MEVTSLDSPKLTKSVQNRRIEKNPYNNGKKSADGPAVMYDKREVSVEYTFYNREIVQKNGRSEEPAAAAETPDAAEVVRLKASIRAEVLEQVKESLGTFFRENPEAVEQVSNGEIPEYFNEENTARRILDIYLRYYTGGEDRADFVESAKKIIQQAYGDVEALVGDLPGLVQDTRELVMEMLDRFAAGEDISDFMGYEVGGASVE